MLPPTNRMYRNETIITVTNVSTESAEPSPMIPLFRKPSATSFSVETTLAFSGTRSGVFGRIAIGLLVIGAFLVVVTRHENAATR